MLIIHVGTLYIRFCTFHCRTTLTVFILDNNFLKFVNQSQQPNIIDDTLINDTMFYLEKLRKLIVIKNNDIPAFFPDKDSLGSMLTITPSCSLRHNNR